MRPSRPSTALVTSPELLADYGAFPADTTKQQAFFDTIDKQLPGHRRSTGRSPQAMLSYPDIPNHQSYMPNYAKAKAALQAARQCYRTTRGSTSMPSSTTLQTTLQGIFDATT